MNILFFADPNSIHDQKWIKYFSEDKSNRTYVLQREIHRGAETTGLQETGAKLLLTIPDFSIVRFYRTVFTVFKIKYIIKKYKIDLINIHYAEPNSLWCLFRWFFKVPMIITTLGTDVLVTIPQAFKKKTIINYLVAPAYSRAFKIADWVTGTSQRQLARQRCHGNDYLDDGKFDEMKKIERELMRPFIDDSSLVFRKSADINWYNGNLYSYFKSSFYALKEDISKLINWKYFIEASLRFSKWFLFGHKEI